MLPTTLIDLGLHRSRPPDVARAGHRRPTRARVTAVDRHRAVAHAPTSRSSSVVADPGNRDRVARRPHPTFIAPALIRKGRRPPPPYRVLGHRGARDGVDLRRRDRDGHRHAAARSWSGYGPGEILQVTGATPTLAVKPCPRDPQVTGLPLPLRQSPVRAIHSSAGCDAPTSPDDDDRIVCIGACEAERRATLRLFFDERVGKLPSPVSYRQADLVSLVGPT